MKEIIFFRVLLTVHLSIILAIDQFNSQILVYKKFIIFLYMFRTLCAHHQEAKIVLCSWPSGASDGHLQSVMIPDAV